MALKKTVFLFIFLWGFFSIKIFSQSFSIEEKLRWNPVQVESINNTSSHYFLSFESSIGHDSYPGIPVFHKIIGKTNMNYSYSVQLYDEEYSILEKKDIEKINGFEHLIREEIRIETSIKYIKKQAYLNLQFIPIRKNANGDYEKLISFKAKLTPQTINTDSKKEKTYASSSVLASGNWYKIAVNSRGVYQISYQQLQNLGINPESIDPRNIRIYGNGGGMLAEANNAFRHDDLIENAIYVHGENDGKFDETDYVLFYGESPNEWSYNQSFKRFEHQTNKYSDWNYYFINYDIGTGKRITTQNSHTSPATVQVNTFNDYNYEEKETYNLLKSGKEWYGDLFDLELSRSYSFSFPNIISDSLAKIELSLIGRSTSISSFNLSVGGTSANISIAPIPGSYTSDYAKESQYVHSFNPNSSSFSVSLSYNKGGLSEAKAWLNYIVVNVWRNLSFYGSQMHFRNTACIGTGNISEFSISNASSAILVWDISDLKNIKQQDYNLSGNLLSFKVATDSLKEFIAFNGSSFLSPQLLGSVQNQNLHALGQHEMIIITHPNFSTQAEQIAEIHRTQDNFDVAVVNLFHIYNEFSSGKQDVSAIRDFMKMFYDRASVPEELPRYLLLFGDASYDYKNRVNSNTNLVPTYQANNSLVPVSSYATDDYFGLLDNNEGLNASGDLDIGIGRFPVTNTTQANQIVEKIKRYTAETDLIQGSDPCAFQNNVSNFADWRNTVCFIADDGDGNLHQKQSERMAKIIDTTYQQYNIDKIYLDAYPQISTPGGERSPETNNAINQRMQKGALIVNYIGHGGEVGWGHERFLEVSDINSWSNSYNLPIFLTATCEFSRYDDPDRISAGEYVFLNPSGGAIGMLTTSRIAFSSSNEQLNKTFIQNVFEEDSNNEHYRLGDLIQKCKVENGSSTQIRNFILLGDPALQLSYPKHKIETTSINGQSISSQDTIRAMEKVTIEGRITDQNGNHLSNFNGTIFPSVYDKASSYTTFGLNPPESYPMNFSLQNNILYKGKASIVNGNFSFSFIVPKDISYSYDFGKISYYAKNDNEDAAGYYSELTIGGSSPNAIIDNSGPEIALYMNDESFVFGGMTDENPLLLAFISDSSGINTVGNGIGHDIVAIMDEETTDAVNLNDYYEADIDSYQSGTVKYPYSKLSPGNHRIRLKAWDVFNNSSEAYTEFIVVESAELKLSHVFNYPNPFTTRTEFIFEHNQACCNLDVIIQIFSITGSIIKTIEKTMSSVGYRADPILWDGTDEFGARIGRGVYVYQIIVKGENGSVAKETGKLVILK